MKLKLFLLTASAMVLATSCSSDAVVDDAQSNNAIKFSATANKASRAAEYFCNNDLPTQFNVWASVQEKGETARKTYFENESFSLKEDASTWTIDGGVERYWPEKEADVFFYASRNHGEVVWNNGEPTVEAFTPADNADAQKDFVYAYTKKNRPEGANKGDVALNFRHALSQIVFKAKNENAKIYVEIEGVKVCKVASKGKFTFPKLENFTDNNYVDHTNAASALTTGLGTWAPADYTKTFVTDFTNVKLTDNTSVFNLTDNVDVKGEARNNVESLLLIPETTTAWVPTDGTAAADQTGSYFLVNCRIRNVAGNAVADNDVYLWGSKTAAKELAIPFAANWEQGKKYVYTFNFTKGGHGGYDPDDSKNVLIPISFTVTVDDFAKGVDANVDADNGNV